MPIVQSTSARPVHYVRFARALAFATGVALPACGSSGEPAPLPGAATPAPTDTSTAVPAPSTGGHAAATTLAQADASSPDTPAADASQAVAVAVSVADATAAPSDGAAGEPLDAADDAPRPHTSGPLAPPELPASRSA